MRRHLLTLLLGFTLGVAVCLALVLGERSTRAHDLITSEDVFAYLDSLPAAELDALVDRLENSWTAPPVEPVPAVDAGVPAPALTYDVELQEIGSVKINVIKAVREITGLGLKESKDLVEAAPKLVITGVGRADADAAAWKLISAGAVVELRASDGTIVPLPVRDPGVPGDPGTPEPPPQTEFTVVLEAAGGNKIAVIKAIRELTGLGLKEAKDLVEAAPIVVREGMTRADAEGFSRHLTDAGATVTIR